MITMLALISSLSLEQARLRPVPIDPDLTAADSREMRGSRANIILARGPDIASIAIGEGVFH
jgi:hypothetical protein